MTRRESLRIRSVVSKSSVIKKAPKKESFASKLKSVMGNTVFICLCLGLTGLYFVVTGIQYWAPDYLQNVLGVSADVASFYFAVTCFTAPVGGVIVGGIVTSALGGYNNPRAKKIQCVMGLLSSLSGLPIPWLDEFKYVGPLFWLLLFFGGFVLPPVTGIMISSVG